MKTISGINLTGSGDYQCVQNMLKGHALAYHIYNNEFRSIYHGKIGLVIPVMYPISKNAEDKESTDIAFEFQCGMSAHPIFSKKGDYPEIVKRKVAERSRAQGYNDSRLPTLSEFWIKYIRYSMLSCNYQLGRKPGLYFFPFFTSKEEPQTTLD